MGAVGMTEAEWAKMLLMECTEAPWWRKAWWRGVGDDERTISAVPERVERPAGSADGHAEVSEDELVAHDHQ